MDSSSSNENQRGKEYYFNLFQEYFFQVLYFPSKAHHISITSSQWRCFIRQHITGIWETKWSKDSEIQCYFLDTHFWCSRWNTKERRKVGFSFILDTFTFYFCGQYTSGRSSTNVTKANSLTTKSWLLSEVPNCGFKLQSWERQTKTVLPYLTQSPTFHFLNYSTNWEEREHRSSLKGIVERNA